MSCQSMRILELAAQKLKEHVPEHSNEEEAGSSNLSSHLQNQYESEEEYNDPFSSDDSIKDKTFTAASAETSNSHGSSRCESEELDSDSDATDGSVDTNSNRSGNLTPNIAADKYKKTGYLLYTQLVSAAVVFRWSGFADTGFSTCKVDTDRVSWQNKTRRLLQRRLQVQSRRNETEYYKQLQITTSWMRGLTAIAAETDRTGLIGAECT
ncbi:hypothetical protein FQA39_LY07543 [Lamprigera yunnana]|nr:hypothetical protein FQA39_LY07543 [Lamprigera yunnana]